MQDERILKDIFNFLVNFILNILIKVYCMRVYDGSPMCRRTDILMFKRKKKIRLIVHTHMSMVMRVKGFNCQKVQSENDLFVSTGTGHP